MKSYSTEFKNNLIQKACQPEASLSRVALDAGIPVSTLFGWIKSSSKAKKQHSITKWTPKEKMRVIGEISALKDEVLGEYLRKNGLHKAYIEQWKDEFIQAKEEEEKPQMKASERQEFKHEVERLKREIAHKNSIIAETTALLVLSKKAKALWGEEGENI